MPRPQNHLSIEFVLLGFLEQKPIHGYDLYKQITRFDAISIVWSIKQSQLYALLERLEKEGLISSTVIPGETHPDRKQYQITNRGRETFSTWRDSPVQHGRDIRMEFLAKVYFALQVSPETVLNLIEMQKASSSQWLKEFQENLLEIGDDQLYERIVFQYRASQLQATLDWLEICRKEIVAQTQPQ